MPSRGKQKRAQQPSPVAAATSLTMLATSGDIELLMDCVDEELTQCQRQAQKKAEQAYRAAMDRIASAKANSQGGIQIQYVAAGSAPPPPPASFSTPDVTNSGRPARRAAQKAVNTFSSLDEADDDVVILDDDPDEFTPNRRRKVPRVPEPQVISPQQQQQQQQQSPRQAILLPQGPGPYQIISAGQAQQLIMNRSPQLQSVMFPPLVQAPMSIPVQRVPAQPRPPPSPQQAARKTATKAGRKRAGSIDSTDSQEPPSKRGRPKKPIEVEELSTGNWVPLDEYYYGKKEGDPAYREEKGEYRFKCWYCHKMLYNNVRIMMHMQGHIDSEKQQNLDLSDLTQCKHCYKQFDTPFEMQSHAEKVHQKKSNVLVCRICEKDHDNQSSLRQHMKTHHNACEMPYICQLCNFRSSVFDDVVDHFKKRHDSSQHVLCLFCLKVFKVNFSKTTGWGMTQNFFQHLQKHSSKSTKKCSCCKLNFINKGDAKLHKQKDHLANFRGAIAGSPTQNQTINNAAEQVMIKLPGASEKAKSLNAPSVAKVQDLSGLRVLGLTAQHKCKECGVKLSTQGHFKKNVECSLCRFATTCNNAYSNHMLGFHSGNLALRKKLIPQERALPERWHCLCGFSNRHGSTVANHMVRCSKRTCYVTPPEQRWFEYDDEQEEFNPLEPYVEESDAPEVETPEKDVPALFGMLGLVKKPQKPNFTNMRAEAVPPPLTTDEVAKGVVDDVLDNIFPAEAAAQEFIALLLNNVDKEIGLLEVPINKARRGRRLSNDRGRAPVGSSGQSVVDASSDKTSEKNEGVSETASLVSESTEPYPDNMDESSRFSDPIEDTVQTTDDITLAEPVWSESTDKVMEMDNDISQAEPEKDENKAKSVPQIEEAAKDVSQEVENTCDDIVEDTEHVGESDHVHDESEVTKHSTDIPAKDSVNVNASMDKANDDDYEGNENEGSNLDTVVNNGNKESKSDIATDAETKSEIQDDSNKESSLCNEINDGAVEEDHGSAVEKGDTEGDVNMEEDGQTHTESNENMSEKEELNELPSEKESEPEGCVSGKEECSEESKVDNEVAPMETEDADVSPTETEKQEDINQGQHSSNEKQTDASHDDKKGRNEEMIDTESPYKDSTQKNELASSVPANVTDISRNFTDKGQAADSGNEESKTASGPEESENVDDSCKDNDRSLNVAKTPNATVHEDRTIPEISDKPAQIPLNESTPESSNGPSQKTNTIESGNKTDTSSKPYEGASSKSYARSDSSSRSQSRDRYHDNRDRHHDDRRKDHYDNRHSRDNKHYDRRDDRHHQNYDRGYNRQQDYYGNRNYNDNRGYNHQRGDRHGGYQRDDYRNRGRGRGGYQGGGYGGGYGYGRY